MSFTFYIGPFVRSSEKTEAQFEFYYILIPAGEEKLFRLIFLCVINKNHFTEAS